MHLASPLRRHGLHSLARLPPGAPKTSWPLGSIQSRAEPGGGRRRDTEWDSRMPDAPSHRNRAIDPRWHGRMSAGESAPRVGERTAAGQPTANGERANTRRRRGRGEGGGGGDWWRSLPVAGGCHRMVADHWLAGIASSPTSPVRARPPAAAADEPAEEQATRVEQ